MKWDADAHGIGPVQCPLEWLKARWKKSYVEDDDDDDE